MKTSTWILLLLALAAMAGVLQLLGGGRSKLPMDLVASARSRVAGPNPDFRAALREFDLAVDRAEARGDPDELAGVLCERARYLQERASYREARRDMERALELGATPRSEINLEIAVLCMVAGQNEDALQYLSRTLAAAPDHGGAHAVRGRVRAAMGESELAATRKLLREFLATPDAARANVLINRAAALERGERARPSLLLAIDDLLPANRRDEAEQVRRSLDVASDAFADAREAFTQSLIPGVRGDAVLGLLDADLRAGRPADAVDFGLAARLHPDVEADARTLQRLASALEKVGRERAAAILLERAVRSGRYLEASFLPTWCRILYAAQEWPQLFAVAGDLSGRTPDIEALRADRAAADFFLGAAGRVLGRKGVAQSSLARFVSGAGGDPIENSRGIAWTWLAEMERERGDPAAERRALEQATQASPELSGENWLRLADLSESFNVSPATPLRQQTHGLRLLPERVPELLPAWIALGARTLVDQGRDVERIYTEVVASGRYVPRGSPSPFELWRFAELHRAAKRWFGVAAACRVLLEEYPRFLPAFDLELEAHRVNGKVEEQVDMLLERLKFVGDRADTLAELRRLHTETRLTPSQELDLMRLDPRHTGVLAMAADLLGANQPAVAARGLTVAGLNELGDAGRVLFARSQLELDRPKEAIDALEAVAEDSEYYTQALGLAVRAALELGDTELLDAKVAASSRALELHKPTLLELIDELLVQREWHPAWTLLHELDSRLESRGGDVTLRVAVAALIAGERAAAREALQRTGAFRPDGSPELGRIILSAVEGSWSRLPGNVRDLRRTAFDAAPLIDVVLLALEERTDAALLRAEQAETELQVDPRWPLARVALDAIAKRPLTLPADYGESAATETRAFLLGTEAARRDPRQALVLLLALEVPEWSLWALADLRSLDHAVSGRMWPLYLSTLAEQQLVHRVAFRKLLLELTSRFATFAPGWDLLERAEEERLERLDHPDLLLLRARRRAALGGTTADANVEADLARAAQMATRGDLANARALAAAAVERSPADLPARLALAGIEARAGDVHAAIVHYVAFFENAPSGVAFDHVPEFIDLVEGAERRGLIPVGALVDALVRLNAKLPADPAVALARARIELRLRADAPVLALGRAFQALKEFRERTDHAPLEFLRAGSAQSWLEFHADHDMERAERFVEEELRRSPTSVALWVVQGALLERRGMRSEALAHYERLRDMVPDPRVALRTAALLAETGADVARVERELERVRALERRPQDDPELQFIRATSYVLAGPGLLDQGLQLLAGLWSTRTGRAAQIPIAELGRRFGASLTHRGLAADRDLAQEVLRTAAAAADSFEDRVFLERMARIARHLPVVPGAEVAEAEKP